MKIESFDNTKIDYNIKKGSKLCLIFVHGWANNKTTWKNEIKFFGKKGYSIISLDLRGHGQSDKPENKEMYTIESFAKDIHCIIKKEEVEQCVLIGHSMGGMISLMYYKLFEYEHKVKALILCDTTSNNVLEHKKINVLLPFTKHVLDFIIEHQTISQNHFKHLKNVDLSTYTTASDYRVFYEGLHNTPLKSVFACLESMLDLNLKSMLSKINVPVLIIEGTNDKILPEIDSIEMFNQIKDAEIHYVHKGKHFVNIENVSEMNKYLLNFLVKHQLE